MEYWRYQPQVGCMCVCAHATYEATSAPLQESHTCGIWGRREIYYFTASIQLFAFAAFLLLLFYLSNKNATCAYVCVSVCLGMWIVKHSSFILQSSPAVNAPRHDDNCRALPTAPNTFNTKCTNVWQRSLGAFASHIIHNSTNLTSE